MYPSRPSRTRTRFSELARRQIPLQREGDKLIAVDPHHRLSPALDGAIRQHRTALVAALEPVSAAVAPLRVAMAQVPVATELEPLLDQVQAAYEQGALTQEEAEGLALAARDRARLIPATIEEMPLSLFAGSGLVLQVRSRVLDEVVLWAADNAQLPAENTKVVYRATELKEVVGMPAAQLQRLHLVKKDLDGEVLSVREVTSQPSRIY